MAPFSLKLCQNAFQMIPNISSFDFQNHENFRFLVADARILGHMCLGPRHMYLGPRHMRPGPGFVHPRPKIQTFHGFEGRKMKCWDSSETRFGKVSGRTEPCLRGKRPFEAYEKNRNSQTSFGKNFWRTAVCPRDGRPGTAFVDAADDQYF